MTITATPGFYQWVRFTKEATWGVRNPSPGAGDVLWARITGDTNFHPQVELAGRSVIRTADAYNRPADVVAKKYGVTASLATPLYPGTSTLPYAKYLLDAALKLSSSGTPDLASYTADHWNGVDLRSFYGGKCTALNITSTAGPMIVDTSSNWVFRSMAGPVADDLNLTLLDLAHFPQPVPSDFATNSPFAHEESAGHVTLGGTPVAVVAYDTFSISIANMISARHYESQWVSHATWCGRDINATIGLLMQDTSWRTDYETQAELTIKGGWSRGTGGGISSVLFDFQGASRLSSWNDNRPLGDVITQNETNQVFYDVAAGKDMDYAVVVPA